jgi:hypothetical protein
MSSPLPKRSRGEAALSLSPGESGEREASSSLQPKDDIAAPIPATAPNYQRWFDDYLTCPVCYEKAREGPIYQCAGGHYVCQGCRGQCQDVCPLCRVPLHFNGRNRLAEAALAAADDFPCRLSGCRRRGSLDEMKWHELSCTRNTVKCPGFHSGMCAWSGEIINFPAHAREKKCVVMKLPEEGPTAWYSGVVHNPQWPRFCIFKCQKIVSTFHWRPTMLLSHSDQMRLLPYVEFVRQSPSGTWIIIPRSYGSQPLLDNYFVHVAILSAPGCEKRCPIWMLVGGLWNQNVPLKKIIKEHGTLQLADGAIRQLASPDKKVLFAYKIRLFRKEGGDAVDATTQPSDSKEEILDATHLMAAAEGEGMQFMA